jgi:hypothetical protein
MQIFTNILFGLLYFSLAVAVLYIVSIVWLSGTHILSTVSKVTQSLSIVVKALIRSLFSEVETDTFYINSGIRIERSRDTFRFIYRERNCTTYIEKTEIRPTTVIEREIRKEIKRDRNRELAIVSLYVFLVLLAIGLLRKLFIK